VYARYHQPIVKKFFLAASIGLLGLVYFEPPTYAAWQLPPEFTMPVEAICLGLIVMRVVAMFSFLKRGSFLTDPRVIMTVAILVFTVLDMVAYIAGYAKGQADLIRWTRVLRPVLVVLAHRQVRRAVNNILRSVSQMLVVVSLLAVLIGITTLLFFVLFQFKYGFRLKKKKIFFNSCLETATTTFRISQGLPRRTTSCTAFSQQMCSQTSCMYPMYSNQ